MAPSPGPDLAIVVKGDKQRKASPAMSDEWRQQSEKVDESRVAPTAGWHDVLELILGLVDDPLGMILTDEVATAER